MVCSDSGAVVNSWLRYDQTLDPPPEAALAAAAAAAADAAGGANAKVGEEGDDTSLEEGVIENAGWGTA